MTSALRSAAKEPSDMTTPARTAHPNGAQMIAYHGQQSEKTAILKQLKLHADADHRRTK